MTSRASLWVTTIMAGQMVATMRRLSGARGSWLPLLGGALTGPFLGIWLSLVAVQNTEVGVASTLMAVSPIFLLPIGRIVFGERIGVRSVAGTLAAIAGVGMLLLV
jgi:drug/metabolite transporter (DMT)-like permease